MSVGLVGVGRSGRSLLGMLVDQREVLRKQFHLDLQIRAVANDEKVEDLKKRHNQGIGDDSFPRFLVLPV